MKAERMTIDGLAALCGVSPADAAGFVECLSIWVAKGYTIDAAIEKHMATMRAMVSGVFEVGEDVRREFAAGLYDEFRAKEVA